LSVIGVGTSRRTSYKCNMPEFQLASEQAPCLLLGEI